MAASRRQCVAPVPLLPRSCRGGRSAEVVRLGEAKSLTSNSSSTTLCTTPHTHLDMSAPPPPRSGMALYANLLDPDVVVGVGIHPRAPVLFCSPTTDDAAPKNPKALDPGATYLPHADRRSMPSPRTLLTPASLDTSLRFQPIMRRPWRSAAQARLPQRRSRRILNQPNPGLGACSPPPQRPRPRAPPQARKAVDGPPRTTRVLVRRRPGAGARRAPPQEEEEGARRLAAGRDGLGRDLRPRPPDQHRRVPAKRREDP